MRDAPMPVRLAVVGTGLVLVVLAREDVIPHWALLPFIVTLVGIDVVDTRRRGETVQWLPTDRRLRLALAAILVLLGVNVVVSLAT